MQNSNIYDAIVIGAGMSGSWAAKELCERGLKTLVIERGRDVKHITDYPTTNLNPWEFEHRGQISNKEKIENPSVARCYAYKEDNKHFFVKDSEHPYIQDSPFDWIRGYQVGGKSLMWARQTQRWSDYDFEGPARDGFAVDWPIRYKDLSAWYSKVEQFVGISGNKDGLDMLPDGDFLPAWELNCVEKHFQSAVKKNYRDRHVIYGRCAHITEQQEIHRQQGRGQCQNRTECERGCPFGGYFSANSSTMPWAAKTGNMTLRPDAVVHSIIYDDKSNKATGVRVIDAHSKETTEYFAKVVFLNAGAINSNLVLLNSTSDRFPEGLGNDSGTLGKYVAFHNYRAQVSGICETYTDQTSKGRRPTNAYLPRFRNLHKQETEFLRGYAAGFNSGRGTSRSHEGLGQTLRDNLFANPTLGPWRVSSHMMGETIPKESNYVSLDTEQRDEWGMPLVHINVRYDDNDEKMIADYHEQMSDMFEKAGFVDIKTNDDHRIPGLDIHEMGGARMGNDPKSSVLNGWHQVHGAKNVFVTDGACMTSTSTQNPSLTYMAMAARAANYAADELKKGELG
ncbi:MAG: choline dehydrogenase-like flavoprotein [Saprospiraceae bacterium]|jgi:choline dehydrogenase-like flavoprotein